MPLAKAGPDTRAAAPASRPRVADRVDGFGAEGLPLSVASASPARNASQPVLPRGRLSSDPGIPAGSGVAAIAAVAQPSPTELTREALRPLVLPALYGTDGRLLVPAPLRGSREVLVHQNLMADEAGLERIRDDAHLQRLYAAHQLQPFAESISLRLNPELPLHRRTARAWTVRFAADTARAFYDRFHQPLQVNSAVRTVAYQLRLQRSNGNAAAVAGDTASPHLTGQAIDFGKRGMSLAQLAWMRGYLLPIMETGAIDVEEEFQQACFHISVYRSYLPPARVPRIEVAQVPTPAIHPAHDEVGEKGQAMPDQDANPPEQQP